MNWISVKPILLSSPINFVIPFIERMDFSLFHFFNDHLFWLKTNSAD